MKSYCAQYNLEWFRSLYLPHWSLFASFVARTETKKLAGVTGILEMGGRWIRGKREDRLLSEITIFIKFG